MFISWFFSRHPFKVPFLQSFFLQETFTVDKKQKHYFMETKVLINGLEETVQTLILGYQPENPYVSYPKTSFSLICQNNLQMSGLLHITYDPSIFSQTSF